MVPLEFTVTDAVKALGTVGGAATMARAANITNMMVDWRRGTIVRDGARERLGTDMTERGRGRGSWVRASYMFGRYENECTPYG